MSKTYVQNYDEFGNKVYKADGSPEFVLKENRVHEPKFSFVHTSKKTDKVFHHEAGKGSRRR